jgi:hypothetical protein
MKRLAAVALLTASLARAQPASETVWDFEARLDDRPIGTHRFVVRGPAAQREVDSRARFDVRLLGIVVYRYRHEAQERWEGDCLRALQSRTDDDGTPLQVELQRPAEADCVMSFAYWHPRLSTQTRLLNPQTGRLEEVRFERQPDATIGVRGNEVAATPWRLTTATQDLTVWRARADGAWVGLDARVRGGRLLTYRLR